MQLNKVLLAGNLTRDPEVRFLANERAVAKFGLACNRRYRGSDGEQKDEATFVDIEAWGRTAELAGQYLTKGRACMVEGRLRLDQWEDKDGNRRSRLLVVADNIQFIAGRRDDDGERRQTQTERPAAVVPPAGFDDEEPPF